MLELASIPRIRIVCNTEVSAEDVKTVRMATGARRKELEEGLLRLAWNAGHFPHLVDVHGMPAQQRLHVLHDLLMASGKDGRLFEIRLVPDSEFGFVHDKGGIIEGAGVNGGPTNRTSFIGSANDSARAWTKNYELVWEDDTPESVTWVQEEFDALWNTGVSTFRIHCQTDRPLVAARRSSSMSARGRKSPPSISRTRPSGSRCRPPHLMGRRRRWARCILRWYVPSRRRFERSRHEPIHVRGVQLVTGRGLARLAVILAYLQEMTAKLPHWAVYKDALAQLAIGVEHHRG